jgi:Uma2 family endonuclease
MRTVVPWAEDVLMTAGELLLLPDDAWRYELVDGRLVRMAPTGSEHGEITAEVVLAVGQFVKERRLGTVYTGEPGYWISAPGSPDTVLAPDLAFVRAERAAAARVPGYPRLAPDLVVEVVSPSQARSEMAAKAERWLEAGVRLVWLVYPQIKQVEVWRDGTMKTVLTIEDELSGEDVLPGFALPIKDLFP